MAVNETGGSPLVDSEAAPATGGLARPKTNLGASDNAMANAEHTRTVMPLLHSEKYIGNHRQRNTLMSVIRNTLTATKEGPVNESATQSPAQSADEDRCS